MNFLTPDSWGSEVKEYNPCHKPAGTPDGGQFGSSEDCPEFSVEGDKASVSAINTALASLPVALLKGVGGLKIKAVPVVTDFYGRGVPDWLGAYHAEHKTIQLLVGDKEMPETLRHELAHGLNNQLHGAGRRAISAAFTTDWLNKPLASYKPDSDEYRYLNTYQFNPNEAFAEAVAALTGNTRHDNLFRKSFPTTMRVTRSFLKDLGIDLPKRSG